MTETKLEAGRELDALVAEKIMGATWADPRTLRLNGRVAAFRQERDWTSYSESILPFYSRDIAAAWPILDKICGDYNVRIGGGGFIVTVTLEDGFEEPVYVTADTAPLAICRAALALVELRSTAAAPREPGL